MPRGDGTLLPCSWRGASDRRAIIRSGDELGFVPDPLLGDNPEAVKRGLRAVFRRHLERDFDHLLFAHGQPWIGGAKAALRRFLAGAH